MEGGARKQTGSSSISHELFGPKRSSSTSPNANSPTGIFDSVFSQPNTYSRSSSSSTEVIGSWRRKDSDNQGWNAKRESAAAAGKANQGRNSIFQDDKAEPHYLSSSLYYGGQDVYSNPADTRSTVKPQAYKKDGEDDDPNGSNLHSASRGNWWQGGLYY